MWSKNIKEGNPEVEANTRIEKKNIEDNEKNFADAGSQEDMTSETFEDGQPDNTYPDSININTFSNLKSASSFQEELKSTETPKLVIKTGKFYDKNGSIPTYKTSSQNRGEVFVINNIMFKSYKERIGAENDDKNLKTVFEQMGFIVTVKRNLSASSMQTALKEFSQKSSLEYVDIGVIIVMSHGTEHKTIGGTEIFGIDDEGIHIDDITNNFNEKECKMLKGKPKIFIFQCCRGDNEQFVQTDSICTDLILTNALIAYSTLPGFKSYRSPKIGTYYISTLCSILCDYAHEHHVEDLLKIVEDKLKNVFEDVVRQTTHYENRGFKRCYFHPV